MPYDASNGSGAAGSADHGRRHQDHPCLRGRQDLPDGRHQHPGPTGVGMTRRQDAMGCSRGDFRAHRLRDGHREHRGAHQDHSGHQDEHQDH